MNSSPKRKKQIGLKHPVSFSFTTPPFSLLLSFEWQDNLFQHNMHSTLVTFKIIWWGCIFWRNKKQLLKMEQTFKGEMKINRLLPSSSCFHRMADSICYAAYYLDSKPRITKAFTDHSVLGSLVVLPNISISIQESNSHLLKLAFLCVPC